MRIHMKTALSDMGPRRKVNEDAILAEPDLPLFAVADGTGGPETGQTVIQTLQRAGKVLQQRAERVKDDSSTASRLAIGQFFENAFSDASQSLRARREDSGKAIAASLVAATVVDRFGYVAHVGDTRAYLVREGELRCLTNDHTLAMLQLQRGEITIAEYATSPFRHTLSQALGVTPDLDVDIAEIRLMSGDVLVLCSNGITRSLTDDSLTKVLTIPDVKRAARELIKAARDAGARDDASVVMFEVTADDERTQPSVVNVVDVIRRVFLFRLLSEPQWLAVARYLEECTFKDGEVVTRQGDDAENFYFVADGVLELQRDGITVGEVGPGGHFGELSLAGPGTATETVTSKGASVAFALSREAFDKIVRHKPILGSRLALGLIRGLGDRLRDQIQRESRIRRVLEP